MGSGLVTMRRHPGYFGLEQSDPLVQFMMRKAVERLRCQLAGQIACSAWALFEFHHVSLCDRLSLAVNRLQRYVAQRIVDVFWARTDTTALHQGGMA